jgi:serine/threonine-protein kinase
MPGQFVGRYHVLAEVARGGMGVVYQAEDPQVGRRVALKMIRAGILSDMEAVERFTREARALGQLSHLHVVQVYDVGVADGRPYFTMQLATGGSLLDHAARLHANPRAAAQMVEKVACAVQHAHERGILHRDLKPANILLGEADEPLVSDFGLAKFLHNESEDLTQTGAMPGTPAYMSPEQAAGQNDRVTAQTDVWALGVILYELLAQRRPFVGQSRQEVLHRIITVPVPPLASLRPEIDPALEAVVMKCLEKHPANRYPSAGRLAEELARWHRGELRPPARTWRTRLVSGVRRQPLLIASLAMTTIVLLILLVALLIGKGDSPTTHQPPEPEPALTLIGDHDPLGEFHWIVGAQTAKPVATEEGFSFQTSNTAAIELLAAPPWDAYRLEALVRHDAGHTGAAGVYIGYQGCTSANGPCHLLAAIGFSDHGSLSGQTYLRLWRMPDANPVAFAVGECFRDNPFTGASRAGRPAEWRQLAVDVTPQAVQLFLDGQHRRSLSAEEIGRSGAPLFNDAEGLDWQAVPRGGVGIFLDDNGTASFRQVTIRRLSSTR